MGLISAKCPNCWDRLEDCTCEDRRPKWERERDNGELQRVIAERDRWMRRVLELESEVAVLKSRLASQPLPNRIVDQPRMGDIFRM